MTFNKHQSVFTLAASLGLFAQDDDEQHPSALVVTTPEVIAPIPEKKRSKQRLHHVSFAPLGPTPSQGERGPYQPTRMVRVVPDRKGRSSRRNKGIITKPTVPQYVASTNDFPVTGTPVTPSPITGAWSKQRNHVSFAPLRPLSSQGERRSYQPTKMVRAVPDRKGRSSRRGIIAKPTVPQYVASTNDFPVTGTPVTPSPITCAWSKQRHHVSFATLRPLSARGERRSYQPTKMVHSVPDRKGRSSRRNKGIIAKPTVPQYVASTNDFPVTGTPVTPSPITGAWATLGERRAAVLDSDFVDPAILKQQEHERLRVAYRKREKHFCQLEKLGQIDFDFSELETDYIDEDRVDVTATLVRHGGAQLSVETDGNQVAWNQHLDAAAEVQKEADRQAQINEYHYFLDNEAGPDVAVALEDLEEELDGWETHEPDAIAIQTGGWFK